MTPIGEVETTPRPGTEVPTFVKAVADPRVDAAVDQPGATDDEAAVAAEAGFPMGRPTLAICLGVVAVAVMTGGMFAGWKPRLFAVVGGLEGVLLAANTARTRRFWPALVISVVGIVAAAILAMAIGEGSAREGALVVGLHDLGNMPALIQKAAAAGRVLRPPAPFDPGWRPLLVVEMGFMGYAAGWVACGLRRPPLGLLVLLPLLVYAAISQPAAAQAVDGIVAFALLASALTVLYRETSDGGAQLSIAFEARRTAKSLPFLAVAVIVLILITRFGGFLFPTPAYDPTQTAQLPKTVPLGDVPDTVLFTVRSSIHGPWRTGVLDVYDAQGAFRIPAYAQSKLSAINKDGAVDRVLHPGVDADFAIHDFEGAVLPIATRPVSIAAAGTDLQYDARTGTIRLAAGQLRPGISYKLTAAASPTADDLKAASPDPTDKLDLQVPAPPDAVTQYLAAAPPSGWARADWVRKEFLKRVTLVGAGLPVAVPASKVVDMLEGSKEGSPFEIVAGEVLLERWAGIPARIGYGFDKGQLLPDGSDEIRPRNGSNWLEVNFKGQGWFPVTGAPLHAKGSAGNKNVINTDQNVLPSENMVVQIFIPLDHTTPALLYEQLRPVVLVVIAVLLAVALAYVLWPALFKLVRKSRRRTWALRNGRRARVAVAYAEFREYAIDLGDNHYAETPLHFLAHVVEDPEHTEFAWMVTRLLWGDLVDSATDDDVHAAQEMSRSLQRRLASVQPVSVRLLAMISRLSLKHPYAVGLDYGRRSERAAA